MTNLEIFPEAWKVLQIDCVRKWEETDLSEYLDGWKYGIPNPKDYSEYLYSNCPGKLFMKFKTSFTEKLNYSISRSLYGSWK